MASPNQPIDQLPGLSPAHAKGLADLGLTTTDSLYRYGQTPAHRERLAATLAVPLRYVTKWMALAELAQIPTVGCEFSGLLLHAGIITVAQLAESTPQRLHAQVKRLHVKTMQRSDLCPTPDQVSLWIRNARSRHTSHPTRFPGKK
jgi:hypothetical protein